MIFEELVLWLVIAAAVAVAAFLVWRGDGMPSIEPPPLDHRQE
jgi:hypothetical protein